MTAHRLEPTPATTHDVFSAAHEPVLTIESGDTVALGALDAHGYLRPQSFPGEPAPRMFNEPRGHCLTGPIAVRGAQPGEMLAIEVLALQPGDWGWTSIGNATSPIVQRLGLADVEAPWLLWNLADGVGVEQHGLHRALAPFLGVMGLAPAEPGEHSTVPPRAANGGNIDCKELVAGSTLYLPVAVPDALLYLGDGHAAQGDGEVSGMAVECPMSIEVAVSIAHDRPVRSIHAETPAGRITLGFHADLNLATGDALDAMITWMQQLFGLDRATTLAVAGSCVDLRVTQVANGTWGVHAVLPPNVLF